MTAEACGRGQEVSGRCWGAVDVCCIEKAGGDEPVVSNPQGWVVYDRWRPRMDGMTVEARRCRQLEIVILAVAARRGYKYGIVSF